MDVHINSLDITSLKDISNTRSKSQFTNLDLSLYPEYLTTELINLTINAIQSRVNTTEYQALGYFTRINLNRLSMWDEW